MFNLSKSDGIAKIPKSRYDTVDMYLAPENADFNDIRVEYNEKYYKQLIEAGNKHFINKN